MFSDPATYGYVGITFFLILTGCGLPIPEEVAIIGAAVAAKSGTLNPWGALVACMIGAIAGDSAMYGIGRRFGLRLVERHPIWLSFLTPEREQKIEALLRKHGWKMILLTRFLVGLRSPVYFTAGVLRVSYPRFLIIDTICAIGVISLFFGLTYFYGKPIWNWISQGQGWLTIAVVLAVVGIGVYYWLHRRHIAARKQAPKEEESRT
jgi:membrane protein DedA with SNARE-associated domain